MTDHQECAPSECGCKRHGGQPHATEAACHPGVADDLAALQARWDQARAMRALTDDQGRPLHTLAQIGAALDPPMSRQRVHQLLTGDRPESPGGSRRPS